MKKNYMTPAVKVAQVKAPKILAGSLGVDITKGTSTQYSKGAIASFDDDLDEE